MQADGRSAARWARYIQIHETGRRLLKASKRQGALPSRRVQPRALWRVRTDGLRCSRVWVKSRASGGGY